MASGFQPDLTPPGTAPLAPGHALPPPRSASKKPAGKKPKARPLSKRGRR